ncbi:15492_t:CDS:2 [Acaulospora morrowiae]|uniref:15492_t:CDS:1 n=1 Tax=Acaulospora morrowiae TaxID=94023 RepID=A0A9N8YQL2_9GLOM|nr:15492_t:CDS:2 [Acaulospora morrowiae]
MNKENKKKTYERLQNTLITSTERPKKFTQIQKPQNTSKQNENKVVKKKQENDEGRNALNSIHEKEQAERRRLLEEYRKKRELEKLKSQKQVKPKKSVELKLQTSKTTKNGLAKNAPTSEFAKQNVRQTPVRKPENLSLVQSKNIITPTPVASKEEIANNVKGSEFDTDNTNVPVKVTLNDKGPDTPLVDSSQKLERSQHLMSLDKTKYSEIVSADKELTIQTPVSVSAVQAEKPRHFITLDNINFYDGESDMFYYVGNDIDLMDPIDKESTTPTSISMNSTPVRSHSKIYSSPVIKVSGKPQRVLLTNQISDDAKDKIDSKNGSPTPTATSPMSVVARRRSKIYSSPSVKISGKAQRVRVQMSSGKDFTPESEPLSNTTRELEITPTSTKLTSRRRSKIYQSPTLKLTGKAQRMIDVPRKHLSEKDNDQTTTRSAAAPKNKLSLTPLNPRERSLIYSNSVNKLSESKEDEENSNCISTPKRSIHPIFKFKAQRLENSKEDGLVSTEKNDTNNAEGKADDNTDQDIELKIQKFFTSLQSLPTSVNIKQNIDDSLSNSIDSLPECLPQNNVSLHLDYESASFDTSVYQQETVLEDSMVESNDKGNDNEKVVESPEESSLTVLTPVKAKKKEREELGVSSVVTPVRRSARNQKSSPDTYMLTPEDQVRKLLEENGFTYVSNPALNCENNFAPLKRTPKKVGEESFESRTDTERQKSSRKSVKWEDLTNLLELVPKNI